jgi:glucose-1-phosphate thymidylyltransferase
MPSEVGIAVVDASAEDELGPCRAARQCRYLTSIANRPLISHVVDGLANGGIDRILIAAGARVLRQLAPVVLGGTAGGVEVSFFDSGSASGGWALVSQLRQVVGDTPLLVQPGDCLFTAQIPHLCDCFRVAEADLVLLMRSPQGSAGAAAVSVGPSAPVRLPRDQPEATALVLAPTVWPFLEQLAGARVSTRSLVRLLAAAGRRVRAFDVGEHWCYSGSPEGLLTANRIVLDAMRFDPMPAKLSDDTDAQGRVVVSATARVSRCALRGPVVIGPYAVVSDSFIGPYTAIGSRATVLGAEIDYTMVLPDAEIRYPGHRLQSSVIGEGALVSRVFGLPTGLRLQLEPGSSVILN